jgi:hypothetical protein
MADSEILAEFDKSKPLGGHIGKVMEFGDDSGNVAVKGGMGTEEVEISDEESDVWIFQIDIYSGAKEVMLCPKDPA